MVQRKAPSKPGSQTGLMKDHVRAERHIAPHQQGTRSKGGGDLRKMKNYMKPTSSSDSKKEQPLVSVQPQPSCKSRSLRNSNNLNYSKPSSSSSNSSSIKTTKVLTRKSSFKLVRPSMKKSSGVALHPKKHVNRATCSSTQKDSKFPEALDLNPGGTEAEGTSVWRVCPYNYCSLNGHRHPPLPPLKSFLRARRSSLRTQKSMKLRRLSSFRKKVQDKDEREMNTGQVTISRTPLMVEEENDIFVEIYVKPRGDLIESEVFNERRTQDVEEFSLTKDDQECGKSEFEEDGGNDALNQIGGSNLNDNLDDDSDQKSDLSTDELDVMENFLEYIECDEDVDEGEGEEHSSISPKDYAEWPFECCCIVDATREEAECPAEGDSNLPTFETSHIDWDDNRTECSDFFDDDFDPSYYSFERDSTSITCETVRDCSKVPNEVCEDVADGNDATPLDAVSSEINAANLHDGSSGTPLEAELQLNDHMHASMTEESYPLGSQGSFSDLGLLCSEEEACQEPDGIDPGPESSPEHAFLEPEKDTSLDGEALALVENEAKQLLDNGSREHLTQGNGTEEEDGGCEGKDNKPLSEIEQSGSPQGLVEKETGIKYGDYTQPGMETEISIHDDETEEDENCLADIRENPEGSEAVNVAAEDFVQPPNAKARLIITRRQRTEETIETREFNPRPPRFLPEEPEPEGEKVDLRHQMMDERKNGEEWMIDYALQQAVTRLAPARKKKVALLVEAFETVVPLPMCEKPLRHATEGIARARPIQACS